MEKRLDTWPRRTILLTVARELSECRSIGTPDKRCLERDRYILEHDTIGSPAQCE